MEGEIIPSSWTRDREGEALSQLEMTLERRHAHTLLTCRLTTQAPGQENPHGAKNITDVTTTVLMYCKYYFSTLLKQKL